MDAVLEVTDVTVQALSGGAGRQPSRALIEAALDWIDDPIGLLDERPVAVADLWRSLVATLLGPGRASVVVVHPADWSRSRVDRVMAAANAVADHVEAVSADRWTGAAAPGLIRADSQRAVRWRVALLTAGALLVIGVAAVMWHRPSVRTVAEGRMVVQIPAGWTVQRVTGGPGSRRLQVSSPDDPAIAMHLTWSYAPEATLTETAEVLARAIAGEPPGVFGDVRAGTTVAGRKAVTYRESRPGRVIDWVVIQAGSTRISIGCQRPTGRESDVRAACDDAVRSAHQK